MKRALFFAAAIAACVPASEELPPTGAAGFVTEPSPATRGEPLVTIDGWTLVFEKVALAGDVSALVRTSGVSSYGRSAGWLWDAAQVVEIYVPAILVGPASVNVELRGNYLPLSRGEDRRRHLGIAPELADRFSRVPEQGLANANDYGYGRGPSLIVIVRAENEGRVKRMDVALTSGFSSRSALQDGPVIDIREDQLSVRTLAIRVEALFEDASGGPMSFADFAAADDEGNADGTISAVELLAHELTPKTGSSANRSTDLLALLSSRGGSILAPR
ncbi:MAG: hypothetical protein KF819_40685 [Labilithrix sp.]|nr:hypothetical protein [Labilithrix sp.]